MHRLVLTSASTRRCGVWSRPSLGKTWQRMCESTCGVATYVSATSHLLGRLEGCCNLFRSRWTDGLRLASTSSLGFPKPPRVMICILNVVDRWSKWAYFIPTHTDVDAKATAEIFHAVVFSRHGMPRKIVSYRDTKFTSQFWDAFIEVWVRRWA